MYVTLTSSINISITKHFWKYCSSGKCLVYFFYASCKCCRTWNDSFKYWMICRMYSVHSPHFPALSFRRRIEKPYHILKYNQTVYTLYDEEMRIVFEQNIFYYTCILYTTNKTIICTVLYKKLILEQSAAKCNLALRSRNMFGRANTRLRV